MDNPFKDLEARENIRREGMGLPPLPSAVWAPRVQETRARTRAPAATTSTTTVSSSQTGGSRRETRTAPTQQRASREALRERTSSFGDEVFRTAFPLLSQIIDRIEGGDKETRREKISERVYKQRLNEKSEAVASSLIQLTIEQGRSVDLLKQLLETVKGLSSPRRPSDNQPNVSLPGGKLGRRLLGGALVAGGAYALYNTFQTDEDTTRRGAEAIESGAGGPVVQAQRERGSLNDELREMVRGGQLSREQANSIARKVLSGEITTDQAREEARNSSVDGAASRIETTGGQTSLGQQYIEAQTQSQVASQELQRFREEMGVPTRRVENPNIAGHFTEHYEDEDTEKRHQELRRREIAANIREQGIQRQNISSIIGEPTRLEQRAGYGVSARPDRRYSPTQTRRMAQVLHERHSVSREDIQRHQQEGTMHALFEQLSTDELARQGTTSLEGSSSRTDSTSITSPSTTNLRFAAGVDPRINAGIAEKVERIKSVAGGDMIITSGYRDPERNARAGGARNSAHLNGNAVDIQFRGNEQDTVKVIQAASAAGVGGIGVYRPGWLHLDTESRRVWGPDFTAGSIPDWAKPALQAHASGQAQSTTQLAAAERVETEPSTPSLGGKGTGSASMGAASPAASAPVSGAAVASASQENAVAERTPAPVTVASGDAPTVGQGSPGMETAGTFNSPNDPGSVEPPDAAERYARLFNMAA